MEDEWHISTDNSELCVCVYVYACECEEIVVILGGVEHIQLIQESMTKL